MATIKVVDRYTDEHTTAEGGSFILISASAPGLKAGTVQIPVSDDAEVHSPIAVAVASVANDVGLD